MQIDVHTANPTITLYVGAIPGIGLGAFFGRLSLYQVLRLHRMPSGYPIESVENCWLNTCADGVFHAFAFVTVIIGVFRLFRVPHKYDQWLVFCMCGSLLLLWGLSDTIEGITTHESLGVHRGLEKVPVDEQFFWAMSFLGWAAAMIAISVLLIVTRRTR
jgi:uncharacterized membrane protein